MVTTERIDFDGAVHHVFDRGNNKKAIFLDESDYAFLLKRLAKLKAELRFQLFAFCLMTNHFHFLIR